MNDVILEAWEWCQAHKEDETYKGDVKLIELYIQAYKFRGVIPTEEEAKAIPDTIKELLEKAKERELAPRRLAPGYTAIDLSVIRSKTIEAIRQAREPLSAPFSKEKGIDLYFKFKWEEGQELTFSDKDLNIMDAVNSCIMKNPNYKREGIKLTTMVKEWQGTEDKDFNIRPTSKVFEERSVKCQAVFLAIERAKHLYMTLDASELQDANPELKLPKNAIKRIWTPYIIVKTIAELDNGDLVYYFDDISFPMTFSLAVNHYASIPMERMKLPEGMNATEQNITIKRILEERLESSYHRFHNEGAWRTIDGSRRFLRAKTRTYRYTIDGFIFQVLSNTSHLKGSLNQLLERKYPDPKRRKIEKSRLKSKVIDMAIALSGDIHGDSLQVVRDNEMLVYTFTRKKPS